MITFDNVAKRYPNGREALAGVTFTIQPGEFVFLTGRSGAGKSSVLKLIALLERPSRGTVTVSGQNTGKLKAGKIPAFRRAIGVVFQDHKLLVDRPIYDNVALPLVVAGTPLKEVDRRVRAALDQVGLLGRERSSPLELSVGEQQRVGIARAVISKPQLLIADEPTGNLDPGSRVEVMRVFKRFQEVGVTVIIASHDPHLVEQFGQREIVLDAGRIASDTLPRRARGAHDGAGAAALRSARHRSCAHERRGLLVRHAASAGAVRRAGPAGARAARHHAHAHRHRRGAGAARGAGAHGRQPARRHRRLQQRRRFHRALQARHAHRARAAARARARACAPASSRSP